MNDTNYGTIQDLEEQTSLVLRPVLLALRELIISLDPDSCEVIRPVERSASYGVGPQKMKEGYCYLMPHTSWINLGFYYGARLRDPNRLLEGTGKSLRHIKIKNLASIAEPAIAAMINQAILDRKSAVS